MDLVLVTGRVGLPGAWSDVRSIVSFVNDGFLLVGDGGAENFLVEKLAL